jgi:hypothetical protein
MNPFDTLQHIQAQLAQQQPTQVIEELSPRTRTDAETWIRRLPIWVEHAEQFTAQSVAIARIIGQRAMRCFGLKLSEDGRVVSTRLEGPSWQTPKPTKKFRLSLNGEEVQVEYTPFYFPDGRTDLVYFVSPNDPVQPHCLSETGYWSKLTPHDAIVACGGAEAYAALLAEAHLRGEAKEFEAVFEGKLPEGKRKRKEPKEEPVKPVVGKHTAQVIAEEQPTTQRTLFEELP